MKLETVTLLPKRDGRARAGHPWVYSNELDMTPVMKKMDAGSLVTVVDSRGEPLGTYTFNPGTLIACRKLTSKPHADIDVAWLEERLRHALKRRPSTPYYRLVHSEGDDMPGLVVDRFGDVLVGQITTAGMAALQDKIEAALISVTGCKGMIWRHDTAARSLEGLPVSDEVDIAGEVPDGAVKVMENGLEFVADLTGGQKTGWFYDQRANHAFVGSLMANLPDEMQVLDVYSHIGGFGLAMIEGAKKAGKTAHVTLVDASNTAMELAKRSSQKQGVEKQCTYTVKNAFDAMEDMAARNQRFHAVVCDPPAFIKSAKVMAEGLKGYEKVARLGAALVRGDGYLTLCSCSHHADLAAFTEACVRGIRRAGRSGRLVRTGGADIDHPQHMMLAENSYLKCLTFQLD
ncbi:MAG: RlmI/RlmK family 23S rRNA methyltransferase [Pseudomonas fluorescens]|nr:MAG: RlmI/RlmK family 23S rRNA methyltransferase [Pseudomonas fluorescens]